ncbi:MAG: imidazole glycerol phosphate synthase subunit HisH [Campylobacterales bacterium]
MRGVVIVDYRMGNLASLINSFEAIGAKPRVIRTPEELKDANRVILPGVGAFRDAIDHLRETGMDEAIRAYAQTGRPLMGICLGMQLLFKRSYEFGEHEGLGLIPGDVVRFDAARLDAGLKVPQMGWNRLHVMKDTPLFAGLPKDFYLYFVHSYHARCNERFVIGETLYGYTYPSAVARENIYGVQPHPEKSHNNGLQILKNFMEL